MIEPPLPFAKPSIGQDVIDEVTSCLLSGWITTGPRVAQFEQQLGEYLQTPHAIAVSSATAGLHLALLSLDLQPGDEVITTPLTFIATLNTIVHAGGKPVLVDIDSGTLNIDITQLEQAITPQTRAIMPVHFAGLPVDLDPLYTLAKRYGLCVIEDCAHAMGASYQGKKLGSFGDIQVFSFHPNKNMTTGEGGCITTRDATLARRIKTLLFHGIDKTTVPRHQTGIKCSPAELGYYDVVEPGYKYNMMDIQAAIGVHQLTAIDKFNARRRALAARYVELLSSACPFILPQTPDYAHEHAWHLFIVRLQEDKSPLTYNDFRLQLKAQGIHTGYHYCAAHLTTYYQKRLGVQLGAYPQAEAVSANMMSLPLFPDMQDSDQDKVVDTILTLIHSAPKHDKQYVN